MSSVIHKKGQVDSIYVDFSKAYDKVNHVLLVQRLQEFGIPLYIIKLIKDYLMDRRMSVKVNGSFSGEYIIPNGIPQGSHLGPILFIIFINSIVDCIKFSKSWLFMDDLKFSNKIVTEQDSLNLQKDFDEVQKWCIMNGMVLNDDKCAIVSFNRSIFPMNFNYRISGKQLKRLNKIRDLGNLFDTRLNFHDHMNDVIMRANRMWSFIWPNTKYFKTWKSIRILYLTLIRPVLLYASPVWRPYTKNKFYQFEKIQHRVIRQLAYLNGNPMSRFIHNYCDRNKFFDLPTIQAMFEITDSVLLYKIMNCSIKCTELKEKFNLNLTSDTNLRTNVPFNLPKGNFNYIKNEPVNRLTELGNKIVSMNQILIDFDIETDMAILE